MTSMRVKWVPETRSEFTAYDRFKEWETDGVPKTIRSGRLFGERCILISPVGVDNAARWIRADNVITLG